MDRLFLAIFYFVPLCFCVLFWVDYRKFKDETINHVDFLNKTLLQLLKLQGEQDKEMDRRLKKLEKT